MRLQGQDPETSDTPEPASMATPASNEVLPEELERESEIQDAVGKAESSIAADV